MPFCTGKRSGSDREDNNIFERQADMLDGLLSVSILETDALDELVCREEDFLEAGEMDTDESVAAGGTEQGAVPGTDEDQADVPRNLSTGRVVDSYASGEKLFQEYLPKGKPLCPSCKQNPCNCLFFI